MQVTLRKAGKIRNKVHGRIAALDMQLIAVYKQVNIYDLYCIETLNKASDEYTQLLVQYVVLSKALIQLRSIIASANEQTGINILLANQAALHGQLKLMQVLSKVKDVMPTKESIEARIAGQSVVNVSGGYESKTTMAFSFITAEQISAADQQSLMLQATLETIQDNIEEQNVVTKLTLDDSLVAVLTSNNII
jgi:hypothetical protein